MHIHRLVPILAVALALSSPDDPVHAGIGIYSFENWRLARQLDECPPRGIESAGGCDQCMPRGAPVVDTVEFCGPSYGCSTTLTPFCDACNGACDWSLLSKSDSGARTIMSINQNATHALITNCKQWSSQSYCTNAASLDVPGAYRVVFELSSPFPWGPGRSYQGLVTDDLFWDAVAGLTHLDHGSYEYEAERDWRERIGAFATVVDRLETPAGTERSRAATGDVEYYRRALALSVWAWMYAYRPNDLEPSDAEFQSDYPPDHLVREIIEIHEGTCWNPFFDDCASTPRQTLSWGQVKSRFRGR